VPGTGPLDRLLLRARDPYGGELVRSVQPRQAPGVTAVGLDPVPRSLRDQRWRDHLAAHPQRGEQAVQLIAGRAGLVAGSQARRVGEAGDQTTDRDLVVEDPLHVDGLGRRVQDRHRDRVLVDIEPEVDEIVPARDTGHGRLLSVCGSVRSSWWMTHA
jgi:hypothetical protein